MVEAFLVLLIAALLAERHLAQRAWDAKELRLVNRILADTPAEAVALDRAPAVPRRRRPATTEDSEERPVHPIGL
jgi:hypothetical protein